MSRLEWAGQGQLEEDDWMFMVVMIWQLPFPDEWCARFWRQSLTQDSQPFWGSGKNDRGLRHPASTEITSPHRYVLE